MIDLSDECTSLPQVLRVLVLSILCLSLGATDISAQIISSYKDQLDYELELRDISQEEFYALLEDEGYEVEDLEDLSREEILEVERILLEFSRQRFLANRATTISDTSDTEDLDELATDSLLLELDSTGVALDSVEEVIYGHSFFRSGQISLIEEGQSFDPPESYILGPGDELSASIFSSIRLEESMVSKEMAQ